MDLQIEIEITDKFNDNDQGAIVLEYFEKKNILIKSMSSDYLKICFIMCYL
ncbi:hypothetical protein SAMN03080594_101537 [Arenibacter palladensis]|uniref:Uncharacterized protein n=1 Tax=Arenibacter palladensis TaxID=237373 RepID=A0A1M4U9A2_9FLAO|nr:hypothetical protein SAMN03080594_101537 [Arenibacter palladensis]